jgi:hypothetical protein
LVHPSSLHIKKQFNNKEVLMILQERIRRRFRKHVKKDGLITAPETLLSAVLKTIDRWLRQGELEYRTAGRLAEADALCELRSGLLKKH